MVGEKSNGILPFGKRGFLVIILVVALLGAGVLYSVLGVPHVIGVDNEFGEVTNQTSEIQTALVVANPNPIGIKAGNTTVNYTVEMNGVTMANGSQSGLHLDKGNTTFRFSTEMQNDKIPEWWVTHIRNDEHTTLRIHSKIHSSLVRQSVSVPYSHDIHTDIISGFNSTKTRPINASMPLVSDPVLYVNETSANWGNVTRNRTPIRMRMGVYNPKTVTYTISEIGYKMTMNGIPVGNGTTEQPYVIPGKSKKTLRMRTIIQNNRLDDWWVSHLRNGQRTQLKISFYAKIKLPNGDTVRVPLRQLTYKKLIQTHIFENDSAEGTLGGANGTVGNNGTTTAGTTTAGTTTHNTATDSGAGTATTKSATTAKTAATNGGTTKTATETKTSTTTTTTTTTDGGGLLALDARRIA